MENIINDFIQYLLPQKESILYVFLFASAVVENLFPPIPGDTITALGAFLVGTGRLNYLMVYLSTTLGSVVGFMCLFWVGKFFEREFFMKKNYSFFSAQSIINAEEWFRKYGYFVVAVNRFVPGIRSAVSIVSGISKLNSLRVAGLALISAAVWNFIWIQVGFMLGNNWEMVKIRLGIILKNYNMAMGAVLSAAVVIYFIIRLVRKKRNQLNNS